jgi:hypothetical protein
VALTGLFLTALCQEIERVQFFPKNAERPVRVLKHADIIDGYSTLFGHEAYRVELLSGVSVVLDQMAARLGWMEHIAPWDWYHKHRVHGNVLKEKLPPQPPGSRFAVPDSFQPGKVGVGEALIVETVVLDLLPQLQDIFGGVQRFLWLDDAKFTTARAAVVDAAKRGLSRLAEELNDTTRVPIRHNPVRDIGPDGRRCTDGPAKGIFWHNEEDRNLTGRDYAKLRKRWEARWNQVVKIKMPDGEDEQGRKLN